MRTMAMGAGWLALTWGWLGAGCAAGLGVDEERDEQSHPTAPGGGAGAPAFGAAGALGLGGGSSSDCREREDVPDSEFEDTNCDGIDGDRERALFVSPLGDDEGPGTAESPLGSLRRAIMLARKEGRDVYVCSATYQENLEISGGVRMFGGFACERGWERTERPAVVAPRRGRPLRLEDVDEAGAHFQDFEFAAPDAAERGESSIAASVVRASAVTFDHVTFRAGKGAAAAAPPPPRVHEKPAVGGTRGGDAPYSEDQLTGKACLIPGEEYCSPDDGVCADLPATLKPACAERRKKIARAWRCKLESGCERLCESDGGKKIPVLRSLGGDGGNGYLQLAPQRGSRAVAAPRAGSPGASGKPASDDFGSISADGDYLPDNRGGLGHFGAVGVPGAGGAGASGWYYVGIDGNPDFPRVGGAGGSSGYPGCGGYPGNPGEGGGASLGLVIVSSRVELVRVALHTSEGGAGGESSLGSPGQQGGPGGIGGRSTTREPGKDGERGGTGGSGGPGGPGGGGPSIGIVVSGEVPRQRAVRFETGSGGRGGAPHAGSGVGDGKRGMSRDVYVIEESE